MTNHRPDIEPQPALELDADANAASSFEALYMRLEEIARMLETGGLSLEQSVSLYEEGMDLAERCQELLTGVEQRIETLRRRVVAEER